MRRIVGVVMLVGTEVVVSVVVLVLVIGRWVVVLFVVVLAIVVLGRDLIYCLLGGGSQYSKVCSCCSEMYWPSGIGSGQDLT